MDSKFKRKRWTVENFLNLAPTNITKFKGENGFAIIQQDPLLNSEIRMHNLENINFTHNLQKKKKLDLNCNLLESLLINENNELKGDLIYLEFIRNYYFFV